MTTPDDLGDSRLVEEALRRQLRWIEDDVMVTLRGHDPKVDRADAKLKRLSDAHPAVTVRPGTTSAITSVRRWSTALFRRVAAKF